MRILGIESSCDETALAILEMDSCTDVHICGELVSSQIELHRDYGGVVPELASREHLKNLPLLFEQLLSQTGCRLDECDRIAVTAGPGLQGCLLMGVGYGRGLSLASGVPLVPVNHIEGHILAPMLDNAGLDFPYLALVVSGGHTEIQIVREVGDYEPIARTIDDAAGEAFDKSAHLLGFEYPGGPELAALADRYSDSEFELPKVMREASGFSFAGLKTAIALLVRKQEEKLKEDPDLKGRLARAIQDAIVDALCFKLKKAMQETGIQTVAVTGGVAANSELRRRIDRLEGVRLYAPTTAHCMDNAAMIAFAAGCRALVGKELSSRIDVRSRWPVEEQGVAV